jgi:choline-glycine betaine transporter
MKRKSSTIVIIIQTIIIALLLIFAIIKKMEADRSAQEADWHRDSAMKERIRAEKLQQELFELKEEKSN